MALKKKQTAEKNLQDKRQSGRNFDDLVNELSSDNATARRWAARDLVKHNDAAAILLAALNKEKEHAVQEAIFDSLELLGGETVVSGLLPLLRSEEASLRNGVIGVLQSMPESVALHIIELLNDSDSDVRIFAIDILQVLAHPDTPLWLLSILKDEQHVNVVATAVDRLAEVGTPEMIDELQALKTRFPEEAYLHFAVDTAISRIKGD